MCLSCSSFHQQSHCLELLAEALVPHLAEHIHDTGVNHQEDTTTGAESENLGDEALVKGTETLLLEDGQNGGPGPVVLGHLAWHLDGVLDTALDDVHGGVEESTDGTTNGTRNDVIDGLALLGLGLGDELADLEDAAKVTGVPENMAPEGGLEAVVHGEEALVADGLDDDVNHAVVLAGRGLVLETDLDELKGDDDEGLGGTGGGTGQDGETLGHLLSAEEVAVELAPLVVGGELGGTLGGFHQDGGSDAAVEAGGTVEEKVSTCAIHASFEGGRSIPLVLDNLLEAVKHAIVVVGAGGGLSGLKLAVVYAVSFGRSALGVVSATGARGVVEVWQVVALTFWSSRHQEDTCWVLRISIAS